MWCLQNPPCSLGQTPSLHVQGLPPSLLTGPDALGTGQGALFERCLSSPPAASQAEPRGPSPALGSRCHWGRQLLHKRQAFHQSLSQGRQRLGQGLQPRRRPKTPPRMASPRPIEFEVPQAGWLAALRPASLGGFKQYAPCGVTWPFLWLVSVNVASMSSPNSAPQVPGLETLLRMSFPTSSAAGGAGCPRTTWLLFYMLSVAALMDQKQS